MLTAAGDLDKFVALARSQLGAEAVLQGVDSLQYEGVLYDGEGKRQERVVLQFKKTHKQRITRESADMFEVTATNGHEGYKSLVRKDNSKPPMLGVLSHIQVQTLVINSLENLYFFQGYKLRSGKIEDAGMENFNGVVARKIKFSYPSGTEFTRYFDSKSGELLASMDQEGLMSKDLGKQTVAGIRFPKKLQQSKDGVVKFTIEFDKITVNGDLRDQVFEFPSLKGAEKVEK